jgi:hypothetical protein
MDNHDISNGIDQYFTTTIQQLESLLASQR